MPIRVRRVVFSSINYSHTRSNLIWPDTDLNQQFKLSDLAMNIAENCQEITKIEKIGMLRRVANISLREAKDAIEDAIARQEAGLLYSRLQHVAGILTRYPHTTCTTNVKNLLVDLERELGISQLPPV